MKMRKRQQCSWSDLPSELLELVALKLSVPDVARFRLVCSSWYNAAKGYPRGPFLMLPSSQESEVQSLQLLSVEDEMKVVYTAKNNNLEKLLDGGLCFGSSHGWLVVLDKLANPWLLNLFSGKEIELPRRENFPHVDWVEEGEDDYSIVVKFKPEHAKSPNFRPILVEEFKRTVIEKAIVSANPSFDKNYKVVIIYSHRSKLAFCSHGDYAWTALCNSGAYQDVVWHDNMLYALAKRDCVVVWDFKNDSVPRKKRIFSPSYLEKIDVGIRFDAIQFYLALSMGDILLIQRYIGDRVNQDGEVVDEEDLLSGEDNQPLVCPYRTLKFKVFKLDWIQETLTEVKSLQDQAVFVGGNQTISLCAKDFVGLKRDSIYFSDNYWDRIDEDHLYGGHDIGIFNIVKDSIDMLCDSEKIEPTPFWVSSF